MIDNLRLKREYLQALIKGDKKRITEIEEEIEYYSREKRRYFVYENKNRDKYEVSITTAYTGQIGFYKFNTENEVREFIEEEKKIHLVEKVMFLRVAKRTRPNPLK